MLTGLKAYKGTLTVIMLWSLSLHSVTLAAQEVGTNPVKYPIYSPDLESLDPEEIYQRLSSQPLDRLSHRKTIDYLVALIRKNKYKKARFVIDDALKRTSVSQQKADLFVLNAVVSQIVALGEKDKEERSALEKSALQSAKRACQLSRENGAKAVQKKLAEMYLGLAGMYEDKLETRIAGDLVKRLDPNAAGEEVSILLAGSMIVVVLGGSGTIIKKILDRKDLNLETKLTIIGMVLGLAKVAVHEIVEISKSER